MTLRHLILKVLHTSPIALSIKEICYHIHNNGYPCEYIMCRYWRSCRYSQVVKAIRKLREERLVKTFVTKIRNDRSPCRYVKCTLVYVKEEQLKERLKLEKRSSTILEYIIVVQSYRTA